MLNKNRNTILIVIFAVVVAIFLWSQFGTQNESNYRTVLAQFDTTGVDQVHIFPAAGAPDFTLSRSGNHWIIKSSDGKQYAADPKLVKNTIDLLNGTKVKRVASQNTADHEKFAITNDKGTRVEIKAGGKELANLILGKFDYIQPKNAQPDASGRQPQGEMIFYAALPGEPTVYVVDGQVGFGVGKDVNSFRDKTLTNIDKSNISEVTMETPGQKTDRLVKDGNRWLFNDQIADSAKVAQYLSRVSRQNGSKFAEVNEVSSLPLVNAVKIKGEDFDEVVIQSFQQDSVNFLVTSTQNAEAVFLDNGNKLLDRFMEDGEFFLKAK
ncbi:MAG: hypothetical protein CO098_06170 [Bacteroidetes bacterium CG_4_9_14_3_um_filter_41_19]|nr:MAG: hypothetical protein CO098_06170 [Bacteroidetes bacterium CG_4_9_14_3_um_filter_41_19]